MKRNYEGMKCGRLTVLRTFNDGKYLRAECLCECGNICTPIAGNVRPNKQRSCGCLVQETRRKDHYWLKTHGQSNRKKPSSEYWAWGKIKQRCYNQSNPFYHNYGGRGITVCQAWMDSFEAFYADMGKRPSPKHSIDRINNNDGYYKENCRWATNVEQMNNRNCNKCYNVMGSIMTQIEVCRLFNVKETTLNKRVKSGMTVMQAVSYPKGYSRGWIED